jgi:hypothetical protein
MEDNAIKNINKLRQLLYPESLEQFSKVTSIITEDLYLTVDNLLTLKEVQKITSSKTELVSYLETLSNEVNPVIAFNNAAKTEVQILLKDNTVMYTFINIPFSYTLQNVVEFLRLKTTDYSRLYKQSLFWVLVSANDAFNASFDKVYKTLTVEEDKPLKCNVTSARMLRNAIVKTIQHENNYMKDTGSLQASGSGSRKGSTNVQGDAMSWRKKSDVSDLSVGGSKKKYGDGNSGKKRRQRFKSDPNEGFKRGSRYDSGNSSGGNSNSNGNWKGSGCKEEMQIPLDNVMYPIIIKYKYSNKEIMECYNKIKDELCSSNSNSNNNLFKKEFEDIMLVNTFKQLSVGVNDDLNTIVIPKNNPLLNFKPSK